MGFIITCRPTPIYAIVPYTYRAKVHNSDMFSITVLFKIWRILLNEEFKIIN
jgi:hypothetical protein